MSDDPVLPLTLLDHTRGLDQFGYFSPGQRPVVLLSTPVLYLIAGSLELRRANVRFECTSVFLNQLLPLMDYHPTPNDSEFQFLNSQVNGFGFAPIHPCHRVMTQSFVVINDEEIFTHAAVLGIGRHLG